MKRKMFFLGTASLIAIFTIYSCSKDDVIKTNEQPQASVTELKSEATAKVITVPGNLTKRSSSISGYILSYQVGHTSKECGNSCLTSDGKSYHLDCQGTGKACSSSVTAVPLDPNSSITTNSIFSLIELYENSITNEATFEFPSRSFVVIDPEDEEKEIWLNIPAQRLKRNTQTNTFIFNDLYFSSTPEFSNE